MSNFKVKFDMVDYKGTVFQKEDLIRYMKHDEIINYKAHEKGNIEQCIWKKHIPTPQEIASPEWRAREVTRILKTGAWIGIKDQIVWLPPSYYTHLAYGKVGEVDLQFRLKRLKHVYFKIEARNNPGCISTLTCKNRGDGETTIAVGDGLWECADGNMNVGSVGIQSKTRSDSQNPCWLTAQVMWQSYPDWLKKEIFSDFSSGDSIAEKMQFMRSANQETGAPARNVRIEYFPAVFNAMDGRHNMKKCILDEAFKWVECNFGDTFTNYKKFIMPGFERRGLFDIFSSPADKDCQSYRDGFELWQKSDPTKITENGTTESRVHRYYSNPLEGIQGAYDMWGDADPDVIYAHIMRERKAVSKDKLLGEVRGFPLNEEEMWGSLEASSVWSNTAGIKERKLYLLGTRFKNEKTKDPCRIYGNLEWQDGIVDSDVVFRQADVEHFDVDVARFAFSYLPQNKEPLKYKNDRPVPPPYIENLLGIDPFNHRYPAKDVSRASNQAMVNRRFRDILNTGINKCPTMIYDIRPSHQDIAFEDAIKAMVFNRALANYESRSDKLGNYCEDRGYFDWLLPEIGAGRDSKRKGDAPSGKGKFLEEGMGLLDAATNKPLTLEGTYHLLLYWFPELLADYLKFNPKNTQSNNLTMSDFQSLIGIVKVLHRKIRQPSELNEGVFEYLLG